MLVPCTPYGINSDRLLVEAVRVPGASSVEPPPWRPRLSWWMGLDLVVVALVTLVLLWRERKRRGEARRAP